MKTTEAVAKTPSRAGRPEEAQQVNAEEHVDRADNRENVASLER
jgi:hypothetical protein